MCGNSSSCCSCCPMQLQQALLQAGIHVTLELVAWAG